MIDFYLIKDDHSKRNSPRQAGLQLAGGLEDESFERLKDKGIIDKHFDTYGTFRWQTTVISRIKKTIIQRELGSDNDVKDLLNLLLIAEENQSGLIAYGD
jgi:hypothetical protein